MISSLPDIIKPIGRICATDEHGFFLNDSDAALIRSPFLEAVQDAVRWYRGYFGERLHSLYLRGTVARGVAIAETSDLDIIVVTHEPFPDEQRPAMNQDLWQEVGRHHRCVNGIETVVIPLEEILDTSRFSMVAFLLKTHSVCLEGNDISPQLPDYRCDADLANDHFIRYPDQLETALEDLRHAQDDEAETRDICQWIMKIILRAGLALVMEQERAYTRDLYPAYELFSKHYPEQQPEMKRALELAIQPASDPETVTDFLTSFGSWMAQEIKKSHRS